MRRERDVRRGHQERRPGREGQPAGREGRRDERSGRAARRSRVVSCLALLLVAGCAAGHAASHGQSPAAHRGTVTGRLMMEGGPISVSGKLPGARPIRGSIEFAGAGHRLVTVKAGRSGRFSAVLPAGTYRVYGRSPRIIEVVNGRNHQAPCAQPASVTVTARHTTRITLTCIVP